MLPEQMKRILEAALMASDEPLSIECLQKLFEPETPTAAELRALLQLLGQEFAERAVELHEVASGFRFQVRSDLHPWIAKLWEDRPTRYSRALLETLALIAYRQPITRSEIENVRGVVVSTNIIKTLLEREWVRVVGHRDLPGKPALYATTKQFLDYFNLKNLSQLPTLEQIREIDAFVPEQLALVPEKVAEAVEEETVVD